MKRIASALLTGGLFVVVACAFSDAFGPTPSFAGVLSGASWSVDADSTPPPDVLAAREAIAIYQGGSAAKDSVTLPDSADLTVNVRAFKNGTQTNGYSTVAWVNRTTARLTVDTTAGKHQRASLHRGATYSPGWLIARSKIAGVQVADSVYVRDAVAPAPPRDTVVTPPDTTPTDTVTSPPPPPPDTTTPPPPPPVDTVTSIATQAERPRTVPTFAIPAPTRSYTITTNLQAALDTARRGDEIRLSGTFTGNYILRGCAAGWITVTSATGTLPAAGVRIRPTTAAGVAKMVTANFEPVLQTTPGACRWAFRGVEFYASNEGAGPNDVGYGIVRFGDYGAAQDQLSEIPSDILLDRVYVHGATGHNNTRCVVLNATNAVVRDSWISDCHARGFDSQAVLWWNTPGQILLENNYLEGAGENVMSGGADPSIWGMIPSDITIRRNHFYKPLAWKTAGWSVKNLFELKNARRVLVENNVFEQVWPASQEGMAIVIKSSKDSCPTCDWQGTVDLTFRNNIVRSAAVGLNLQARDGPTTLPVARVTVTDNLFERIGAEGRAALMLLTHDLSDVTIHRNVFLHDPSVGGSRGSAMTTDYANGAARRLDFRGNVMMHGAYGFIYNGAIGSAALQGMAGDGSWRYLGNTMVGGTDLASKYPTGNTWLATLPTLDLTRFLTATAGVVVSP